MAVLLRENQINHVLLVTYALHMECAKYLFKKQGLQVEVIATDYEATVRLVGLLDCLPDAEALSASARAMKELVGRLAGMLGVER